MADVVKGVAYADVKRGVAGHAELFASRAIFPSICASEFVLAVTGHAFHDFGGGGTKGQVGGQHHTNRFFNAISGHKAVADAFAVKVDAGLGVEGDVGDAGGGHGALEQ